ncbi:hypothetical protein SUDANB60_05449 [Streptomyces sp. enrichment culture]
MAERAAPTTPGLEETWDPTIGRPQSLGRNATGSEAGEETVVDKCAAPAPGPFTAEERKQ